MNLMKMADNVKAKKYGHLGGTTIQRPGVDRAVVQECM